MDNGFSNRPNHDAYSNPGTRVRAQNHNFSAGSQADLTRGWVLSAVQAMCWQSVDFTYQVVEMGGVQTLIFLSQSGNDEVKVSSYQLYLWSLFGCVHMALDKFSTGFKKIWVFSCSIHMEIPQLCENLEASRSYFHVDRTKMLNGPVWTKYFGQIFQPVKKLSGVV